MRFKSVPLISALFTCLSLVSCGAGGDTPSLPTSKQEKVQFAFNGVEKSLKNVNTSSRGLARKNLRSSEPTTNTLTTIWNALEDQGSASQPDIGYNDTPLIQFQYLKALYEESKDSFEFNTKYSHTLTGTIYFDFDSDEEKQGEQYLQNYNFIFSVSLNIDENDFIFADVGFDITFTHLTEVRHEYMYAELQLDYDMQDNDPTFTFIMRDVTDLLEFPNENERLLNTEYNYIDVQKNIIKEWRKFGIASKTGFNNYQSEDFVSKYSVLTGFKNNKNYKITDPFVKNDDLKEAVIIGLGLKDTVSSYKSFYSLPGQENSKIQTVVDKFNRISGKDFVYHLAESGADEEWESHQEEPVTHNQWLALKKGEDYCDSIQYLEDFPIQNIYNDYKVVLLQDDYEVVDVIGDWTKVYVKFKSDCYPETNWIEIKNNNLMFSDVIKESGYKYREDGYMSISMDIVLGSNLNVKVPNPIEISLFNEEVAKELAKSWPSDYLNLHIFEQNAIPPLLGDNIYYDVRFMEKYEEGELKIDGKEGYIALHDCSSSKVEEYADELINVHGFKEKIDFYSQTVSYYYKRINNDYILKLTLASSKEDEARSIHFEFVEDVVPETSISEYLTSLMNNEDITLPEFTYSSEYSIYEDYKDGNVIRIPEATTENIREYIRSLSSYGFSILEDDYSIRALQYLDRKMYSVYSENGHLVRVNVTPMVFSFVGLGDNWDQYNEEHVFIDFVINEKAIQDENKLSFVYKYRFNNEESFKVILNHDWAQGSYGYEQLEMGDKPDENLRSQGEYQNIQVVEGKAYNVIITFALGDGGTLNGFVHLIKIQLTTDNI